MRFCRYQTGLNSYWTRCDPAKGDAEGGSDVNRNLVEMLQAHRLIANCDHGEYFSILGKGEETGLKGRLNQSLGAKASKKAKAARRLVAMWWEGGGRNRPFKKAVFCQLSTET